MSYGSELRGINQWMRARHLCTSYPRERASQVKTRNDHCNVVISMTCIYLIQNRVVVQSRNGAINTRATYRS
jgi:hypothetical protein